MERRLGCLASLVAIFTLALLVWDSETPTLVHFRPRPYTVTQRALYDRNATPYSDSSRALDDRHATPYSDSSRALDDRHATPYSDSSRALDDRKTTPLADTPRALVIKNTTPFSDSSRAVDDRKTTPYLDSSKALDIKNTTPYEDIPRALDNRNTTPFADIQKALDDKNSCRDEFLTSHFMTIARNDGRLGNNVFRLLTLLSMAKRYCYTPVLDMKKFQVLDRTFNLSFIGNMTKDNYRWKTVSEVICCKYQTQFDSLNITFNWTLNGFLQTWRYMQGQENYIRSTIKFGENIMQNASEFINGLRRRNNFTSKDNVVCVHVRRGDFVSSTIGYTVANVSYFNKSMTYYRAKLRENRLIFVFMSDDMAWVKKNVLGDDVFYSNDVSAEVDFAILTLGNHSVITGGSFGYLGAWLSGGSVVYFAGFPKPGSWLATQFNLTDYYPKHWVAL